MSEFSESYHLRSTDITEGIELLRRSGLKGYVFPSKDGWISFVAEGIVFRPDERITSQNTGILIHYVSAEDHGWSFTLFVNDRLASQYSCVWDDDLQIDDSGYSADAFARASLPIDSVNLSKIEAVLHPHDLDTLLELEPSRVFAESIELPHFEWFAYDYVARDFHENPSKYDGIIKVV